MKSRLLMLFIVLTGIALTTQAQNVLTFNTNNGAIIIIGYLGPQSYVTNVDIPDTINGYPVTRIRSSAFGGCTGLTNLMVGNNVTNIGALAFYNCRGLTSVVIPNSMTSIEQEAFSFCTGLTNLVIGNSVTNIGNRAFAYCASLRSVVIPNSLVGMGFGAFLNCTGLTSVVIPNSVTNIGNSAFFNCSGLTNVAIPNSVRIIEDNAFQYCSGLTSMAIPNSVRSVGDNAFQYCSGLMSMAIPNSVTNIGNIAFQYCSGLTNVAIPNSVTSIGSLAFASCSSLTNITVDAANANFRSTNGVLFNKTRKTLITFPAGVYGSYAVPVSVTSIMGGAFRDCTGLTSVVIPNSVTNIGTLAFYSCPGLTNITFLGNRPAGTDVIASVPGTVYYYYGKTGWAWTYGGLPTVMLGAPAPQIGSGSNVGIQSGNFRFAVAGVISQTIFVEASTNLLNWHPVWTNRLTSTTTNFTDLQWTNHPSRFYRARSL